MGRQPEVRSYALDNPYVHNRLKKAEVFGETVRIDLAWQHLGYCKLFQKTEM
jgi:hypothetical protein